MAAPILWAPGKNAVFLQENHVRKIPRLGGGNLGFVLGGGGGSANFIFMGAGIFLISVRRSPSLRVSNWLRAQSCGLFFSQKFLREKDLGSRAGC